MLVPASGAWRCPQRALSAARTARSRRRRRPARPSTPTIAKGSSTIKKVVPVDPRTSLSAETLLVAPLAMGFLAFSYTVDHHGQFSLTTAQFVLLASSGLLTAAPLLFFGAAARANPRRHHGLLQYTTPILQLVWAVLVRHEAHRHDMGRVRDGVVRSDAVLLPTPSDISAKHYGSEKGSLQRDCRTVEGQRGLRISTAVRSRTSSRRREGGRRGRA